MKAQTVEDYLESIPNETDATNAELYPNYPKEIDDAFDRGFREGLETGKRLAEQQMMRRAA
jgi:hypothetical protein